MGVGVGVGLGVGERGGEGGWGLERYKCKYGHLIRFIQLMLTLYFLLLLNSLA